MPLGCSHGGYLSRDLLVVCYGHSEARVPDDPYLGSRYPFWANH